MELPKVLAPHVREGISRWTGPALADLGSADAKAYAAFAEVLDALGEASGEVQHLKGPLTTVTKLREARGVGEDRRCYVLREGNRVLGLVHVGPKHLYYWQRGGGTVQMDPLCVLDFYVGAQRSGFGLTLFDAMLAAEGLEARSLAYDRPSPKMLPFLRKHYGLSNYNEQPNNFVVFDDYFAGGVVPLRRTEIRPHSTSDKIQAGAGRTYDPGF